MGGRVIACASSADKLAFAREHGADETIDYSTEDLKLALRALTQDRGVDVLYDPVGGAFADPAVRSMAWDGRYLVVGFAAGEIPKVPLNLVLLKNCDLRGVAWGAWTERDLAGHRANTAQLLAWEAAGKLRTHVHAVFPFTEAAEALKTIARREVKGKVILRL
jgi:NADPH2:quinone reductase